MASRMAQQSGSPLTTGQTYRASSPTMTMRLTLYASVGGQGFEAVYACVDADVGCTDPVAANFLPSATVDDGTCYSYIAIQGCTQPRALNYNASAVVEDRSCRYSHEIETVCVDEPGGWESAGDSCAEYAARSYCTVTGDYGSG